ncbi:glycosyl hydrolase 108 family protein [Rhizobium ruizarguesonis]
MGEILIDNDLLMRAAKRNSYFVPPDNLVFFGIRGMMPVDIARTDFSEVQVGRVAPIDFLRMRCTIGQWRPGSRTVALFAGSTVPSRSNVQKALKLRGAGTNLLMLGRYEFVRGDHKPGKQNGHRAFRQGGFEPVWRTADDLDYDPHDIVDTGTGPGDYVWDNIHCAYHDDPEAGYSSAGCQVVCGLPRSPSRDMAQETGPWRVFVNNGYESGQQRFTYFLFSARELAQLGSPADSSLRQVVRYGSSGAHVRTIQTALGAQGYLQGPVDGEFGRQSLLALLAFQRKQFGPDAADGVCGPATAAALGVVAPLLDAAGAAEQPATLSVPADTGREDLPDESDVNSETGTAIDTLLGALQKSAAANRQPPTGVTSVTAADGGRANFERCQAVIKAFEGGFVNDPHDPGKATNFGITIATLSRARGRNVTPNDVQQMSYDEAKDILFEEYWLRSACQQMPGPLALAVYNATVHCGPKRSAVILQRVLNDNGAQVSVDGAIGKQTLTAIAAAPLPDLLSDVIDGYEAFLRSLKIFPRYGKGFLRRVARLRLEATGWLKEQGSNLSDIQTPKVPEEDTMTPEQRSDMIKSILDAMVTGGPLADGTSSSALASDRMNFVDLLRSAASDLEKTIGPILPPNSAATTELTPVNGALGQWLGKLLDGRKSALGIIAAVVSALFLPAQTTAGGTGSVLGDLIPYVGMFFAKASPIALPISLGLTLWGLLGKQDKIARAVNLQAKTK